MATSVKETNQVEEQPATYHRNFQVILVAGLVFVVVVMVYASLFRAGPGERQVEEQVQQELGKQRWPDPEQAFRARIKSQEQRLLQQREQDLSTQRDYVDEQTAALEHDDEQVLQELLRGTKSALESWDENETVRVRQSRQAAFAFEFFTGGGAGQPPAMDAVNPTRHDGFLRQERAVLAALRQQLARPPEPTLTTGALAVTPGGAGWAAPPLQSTPPQPGGAPAPGAGTPPAGTSHFNLAGYPESELAQPPGADYALLPIGSIMHAKLDQKIISDFAGPYRCRIEQNVMDVSQRQVLIPAGSLCTGAVIQTGSNHPNRVINNRMALSVRWIVRPDGSKVKFTSRALDHAGVGAVKGRTNYHLSARLGGAAAFALLSAETARADYSNAGAGATFESELGESLREAGAGLSASYIGLVPTQSLDYGQQLRLFVSEDLYVKPWSRVYERLLGQG